MAHHRRPVLHIGKGGASEAAVQALEEAFSTEELLKVKVLETAPSTARDTAHQLAERLPGMVVVQVLGRVATLFRRHPEKPQITLPD